MLKEETCLQNTALHIVGPQETFVKREKSHGQSPGVEERYLILFLLGMFRGEGPHC